MKPRFHPWLQKEKKVTVASISSSHSQDNTPNEESRIELFYVRVISNHTKIDALLDSGSQPNLILEDLVKKLNLETVPHHKPYPLGWIVNNANLQVTRKCLFKFAITEKFIDEVEQDVVPLNISGIILGSTYLYDRKAVFYHHENKYLLLNNGVEYIVRADRKKLNISLVNAGHMKRLVNASKNFVLLMIKKTNDIDYESFEGCDDKLKYDLFDVVSKHREMFQEPKGLLPKRGIQHGI